jgi:hypothetical protein
MPQFDLFTFSVQYLTFFASFCFLYLFNVHVIIPQCARALKSYTAQITFLLSSSPISLGLKKYIKNKF